jgi:hypothetical protein
MFKVKPKMDELDNTGGRNVCPVCPVCGDALYETNWNDHWYMRYCLHHGCPQYRKPYHPGRMKGDDEPHKRPSLADSAIWGRVRLTY